MSNENKLKEVLKNQIPLITPSKEDKKSLEKQAKSIIDIIKQNIKKQRVSADVFIGGSFAKNTLIKKQRYDIDIFVRFDSKKYKDKEISAILGRIMPKSAEKLHGSRDYFRIKSFEGNIEFEVIPTLKINKPEDAKNITDLSYFHVNYVEKQLAKNKKLADEIRFAKAFAYYQNCYGAESYINGFSGYAMELLIINYKSFLNFIKAASKADSKKEKILLDPAKHYKNKQNIEREMNESKINSPIIMIDPTYKERNALAALSPETFIKFRESCRKFLKNPANSFFEMVDIEKKLERKFGKKLIKLDISTEKQAGDIAGTKLRKFSRFFLKEAERYFNIKESEFIYDEKSNTGKILLAAEQKKEIVFSGPPIEMKEPLKLFKKKHKKIKMTKGKAYAYEHSISFEKFLNDFENEKSKIIADMDISGINRL